jgi:chromosome segregation ATPase
MPTPETDDAAAATPAPLYTKISMEEQRLANEKAPAPQGEAVLAEAPRAPFQSQTSIEQILNGFSVLNERVKSLEGKVSAHDLRIEGQNEFLDVVQENLRAHGPELAEHGDRLNALDARLHHLANLAQGKIMSTQPIDGIETVNPMAASAPIDEAAGDGTSPAEAAPSSKARK